MADAAADYRQADVVLVQMPYTWLTPSLALGILKADLVQAGVSNEVVYASHHFARLMGTETYQKVEEILGYFGSSWEMLFAPYTDFVPMEDAEQYFIRACKRQEVLLSDIGTRAPSGEVLRAIRGLWPGLRAYADRFLDLEAEEILKRRPRIVGCSVLTQQRNASLALVKRIRQKDPSVVTILGGGCCSGAAGPVILDRCPSLDMVFSGEGDNAFGEGCRRILEGEDPAGRPPAFLKRGDPPVDRTIPDLNTAPVPDYTEYFAEVCGRDGKNPEDVTVLVEGSRGCRWGETGGCRFCGLHSCEKSRIYRPKSFARIWEELELMHERYGVRQFMLSDCMLDPRFIRELPDEGTKEHRRYLITAECRSDMRERDMRALKRNGFIALQAGIESLSDEALRLMNKGVTSVDQLACLKYAGKYGVRMFWNIMYGFPGEEASWYDEMVALMGRLHHFQPPTGLTAMILVRNSDFWCHPEQYGLHGIEPVENEQCCSPDPAYAYLTANFFRSPDLVADPGIREKLSQAAQKWSADYQRGSRLYRIDTPSGAVVRDERDPDALFKKVYPLSPLEAAILDITEEPVPERTMYRILMTGTAPGAAGRTAGGAAAGTADRAADGTVGAAAGVAGGALPAGAGTYPEEEIRAAVQKCIDRGILYQKNGRILSLVLPRRCEPFYAARPRTGFLK